SQTCNGGGIYTVSNVSVTSSQFRNNKASGMGGGLFVEAAAEFSDVELIANVALRGAGAYASAVALTNATISYNVAFL
ncbi:hypothetical protein SARC_15048, partial [Sphaeroforma arctica JP610]